MYFMLKDAPLVAVQQTETQDAPGVEAGPSQPGGTKYCRLGDIDALIPLQNGDYVIVLPSGAKRVVMKDAFEAIFKAI